MSEKKQSDVTKTVTTSKTIEIRRFIFIKLIARVLSIICFAILLS